MKTSTIVMIAVAVLVVGGACIGIPLSGVLNDTSGTSGNDPVQPTDPSVEPTPTETPTQTPTSTPMSYFSGGGSKSDSGSSSVTPTPTPTETPVVEVVDISDGGVIQIPDDIIAESPVFKDTPISAMTIELPPTYEGTSVTFNAIPETLELPGTGNAIIAVDITLDSELPPGEGVEITFTVPLSALGTLAPADALLYHLGENGWDPLTTTYVVSGTDVIYSAIANDFSPFALVFEEGGAESLCEHEWRYTSIEGEKHQKSCTKCDFPAEEENCSFTSVVDATGSCICGAEKIFMASVGESDEAAYYSTVNEAIKAAISENKEVTLLRDMSSAETVLKGETVTINPNGKHLNLIYQSIADIKIKSPLVSGNLINATSTNGENMVVTFTDTPENGLLVVHYAKYGSEMHICNVAGLNADTINSMDDGSTIYIKAGEYQLTKDNPINVDKAVTIKGEGTQETVLTNVVFDVDSSSSSHKMDVMFDNLKFMGDSRIKLGVRSHHNGVGGPNVLEIGDLTVKNSYVKNTMSEDSLTAGKGQFIYLDAVYTSRWNITLTENTMINAHTIEGEDASPVINGNGLVINKVEITGNTFGSVEDPCERYAVKFARRADGTTITIIGNTVYGATTAEKDFYILDLWQSGSDVQNDLTVTVTGNTIKGTPDSGRTMYNAYIEASVKGTNIVVNPNDETVLNKANT